MKPLAPFSVLAVGVTLAVGAMAQTDSTGDDALDAIREQIPEGFPGEFDLTEASAEFGQLVTLFGESSVVADYGTGSQLTGPCGGFAYSYDEDGILIDAALDAGVGAPPVDLLTRRTGFYVGQSIRGRHPRPGGLLRVCAGDR